MRIAIILNSYQYPKFFMQNFENGFPEKQRSKRKSIEKTFISLKHDFSKMMEMKDWTY